MSRPAPARPESTEYAAYYGRYVSLVPEGDVVATLASQLDETLAMLRSLPEERGTHRYAPDKWSVKELVGHLIDAERIFAYRALRIARNDPTPLAGFEQDGYIENAAFDACALGDLLDEFEHVRRANVLMLRTLPSEAWHRRGVASEHEVTVRALAFIMAGHELHHVRVLREKYLC
jgi:hypothetical protein